MSIFQSYFISHHLSRTIYYFRRISFQNNTLGLFILVIVFVYFLHLIEIRPKNTPRQSQSASNKFAGVSFAQESKLIDLLYYVLTHVEKQVA